jgi:site-specific recombinase XerD
MVKTTFPQEMHDAVIGRSWLDWIASWQRSLEAAARAGETRRAYRLAMMQLGKFCVWRGYTQDVTQVSKEIIENFLILTQNTNHSAYTVQSYYDGCKRFYNWMIAEGEIAAHPMAKMKEPKVPETDREVMSPEHIAALLRACQGNEFNERRDTAIIMVLIDTGLRLKELQSITLANLDLRDHVIHIPPSTSKGGKVRDVPIGTKATAALDRYIRKRASHKYADLPQLWIGRKGAIGAVSIAATITKRAKDAGIPHTFPHLFRHTFAHMWLSDGGQEGDLKAIGGWRSDVMERYGRKLKGDRARNAHKLHSPGDKF